MNFKQDELEQENKNLKNQINRLKNEIECLNDNIEKTKKERLNLNLQKSEIEDVNDTTRREILKKIQSNLSTIVSMFNKIKKKYNQEVYKISIELEKLQNFYESKLNFLLLKQV